MENIPKKLFERDIDSINCGLSDIYLIEEDQIEKYLDYPENSVFEVEACGMAMCLMKVVVLEDIITKTGQPFFPVKSDHRTLGEDLSFCFNARRAGHKIWATSKPNIGHIGKLNVDAESYRKIREYRK